MEHWNERRRMEERERQRSAFGLQHEDEERYRNEDDSQRFGVRSAGRDRGRDDRYGMRSRDDERERGSPQWQGGTSEGYRGGAGDDRQRRFGRSDEEQGFSPDWSQDDVRPRSSDEPYYARNREQGGREGGERRTGRDESSWMRAGGQGNDDSYYAGYYTRSMTPFSYGAGRGQIFSESLTLSGPYSGRGPKGYKRSTDQIIDEASRRLEQDGRIDASDIEVSCEEGIITLRGSVPDRKTKRLAEECVESVYGIRDVMNELRIASSQDAASGAGAQGSRDPQSMAQGGMAGTNEKGRAEDGQNRLSH